MATGVSSREASIADHKRVTAACMPNCACVHERSFGINTMKEASRLVCLFFYHRGHPDSMSLRLEVMPRADHSRTMCMQR